MTSQDGNSHSRAVSRSGRVTLQRSLHTGVLLAATAMIPGTGATAFAQNNSENRDSGGVEEIVVTARRFEENLQQTGGAITAISTDTIEDFRIDQANDLQNLVPNLVLKRRGGAASRGLTIKIRGIGTSDTDVPTADPSVGLYIDGIVQGRAFGSLFDLFEIERIEVLRGPQGTLYGKNTLGGAINVITKKPDGDGRSNASVTFGNFNNLEIAGSKGFTLIEDRLFGNVAGVSKSRDGFYDNALVQNQEFADTGFIAARASFHYAGDGFTGDFVQDYSRQRQNNYPNLFTALRPGSLSDTAGMAAGFDLNDFVVPFDADYDDRRTISADLGSLNADALPPGAGARGESASDAEFYNTSLILEFGRDDSVTYKSLTGYRGFRSFISQDLDGTPVHIADQVTEDRGWQFTQEFQANFTGLDDRLNMVAGLFWFHEELETDHTNPFFLGLLPQISALRLTTTSTDSIAGFFHGVYSLTDKLKVSAGLRYNYEEKEATLRDGDLISITVGVPFQDQPDNLFDPPADGGTGDLNASRTETFDSVQPKVGLEYIINDDLFVYTLASRGFASGGFNGRVNAALDGIETFDQETLWNYEVGFKSAWFQNRLHFNVAAFYLDYDNIVVQSFGVSPGSDTEIGFFLQNAGAATVQGLEVELTARPVEQLTLTASLGTLDQEFDEFGLGDDGQPLDPADANFFDSPDTTFSFRGLYRVPIAGRGELSFSADYSSRSRTFFDNDGLEFSSQPSYDLFNARVTWSSPDDRWSVGIFGDNIFDETYVRRSLNVFDTALGFASSTYGDPRIYGITLTVRN